MNKKKITMEESMRLRVLHQEVGVSCYELCKRYPQFAERSVYRHAKIPMEKKEDLCQKNKGRPKKTTPRMERNIVRALNGLRKSSAAFSSKRIQEEAGLSQITCNKTVRRVLRKHGYKYVQTRKKGLLMETDKRHRLAFAKLHSKKEEAFWTTNINFYFDGVGFAHKYNPCSEARATSSMAWRLPKEGVSRTTKGKKEGSGGCMPNFFVAISHDKGVVLCKHYTWTVTGVKFAEFVNNCFPLAFQKCAVPIKDGVFLQDGDHQQNSKVARESWEMLGVQMFKIPARSPDLNPIENMFQLVREQLKKDAMSKSITKETYDQFSKRVAQTLCGFPAETINNLITSMPKKMKLVLKQKGGRTKY